MEIGPDPLHRSFNKLGDEVVFIGISVIKPPVNLEALLRLVHVLIGFLSQFRHKVFHPMCKESADVISQLFYAKPVANVLEGGVLKDSVHVVSSLVHLNVIVNAVLRSIDHAKISFTQRLCLILDDLNDPFLVCGRAEVVQLGENTDSPFAFRVDVGSEGDLKCSGHADVLVGVLNGEDDGVVPLDDRDIEVLDLLADVATLAPDGCHREAGRVGELEVRVIRGEDVEDNRLVTHVLSVADPVDCAALNLLRNTDKVIKGLLRIKFISAKNDFQFFLLVNLVQPSKKVCENVKRISLHANLPDFNWTACDDVCSSREEGVTNDGLEN